MLAVAIDRSYRYGVEVFAIVASSLTKQSNVIKYADFFKHMKKLGRYQSIYVPKMLRIVSELVESGSIAGLRVVTSVDALVRLITSRPRIVRICVVDDTVAEDRTRSSAKVVNLLLGKIPMVVLENQLRGPSRELIETLHKLNVKLVFLRTLHTISDNIASYAWSVFEEQLQKIPQVWRL